MEGEARREAKDWLRTVRQSVPHAWRIARAMRPTFDLAGLVDLEGHFLAENGVRGLLWDVDGTLTHYHAAELAPEAEAARRLLADPELSHAIVSNCDDVRLEELGRIFREIPVLKVYAGAGHRLGRRLESGRDRWFDLRQSGHPEVSRPTEVPPPVRKPSAEIIEFAVGQLGLPPQTVLMVGDQYWTDVAGANLGGIRSARVPTIGTPTFPPAVRGFQRVERWMRRILA